MTMADRQGPTRQFVAGRFRLVEEVRQSEGGTDWRGEDAKSGRQVAIRELRLPEGTDATARRRLVARMLRETELMSLVRPGRVVTVVDVAEEDGRLWQVAELVEARPLSEVLAHEGAMDPVSAVRLGLDLLDVLGAAHREGITHGDVNPSQVLLRPDGGIVLTGFGVTTMEASMPISSPVYASPERARGESPGPASDLWSLGAVLYVMVEGRPPYRDRGESELTLATVASDPVPPVRRAGPLLLAINGLLRKNPQERADEPVVRRVLERILTEAEEDAAAEAGAADATAPDAADTADTAEMPAVAPSRTSAGPVVVPAAEPVATGLSADPGVAEPAMDLDIMPPLPRTRPVGQPEEGTGRAERDRRRRPVIVIAGALIAVLAAVAGLFFVNSRLTMSSAGHAAPGGTPSRSDPGAPGLPEGRAPSKPSVPPSPPASPPPKTPARPSQSPRETPVALPPGYTVRSDPTRFSIALPDGWQRVGNNGFSTGSRFSAPGDPRNLLVDFTNHPGPDSVAAWRVLEKSVSRNSRDYSGYHRIGEIRSVQYRGWNSADWEWTFTYRGTRYRTLNRGFIVDGHHGFAIKWTVPAGDWESEKNQRALDVFLTSFQPKTG
jgi:serine/threonine protein kinase